MKRKENWQRTAEDVSGVADKPMGPIEDEPLGSARMRPEVGHDRLDKCQKGGDDADDRMRIDLHRQ